MDGEKTPQSCKQLPKFGRVIGRQARNNDRKTREWRKSISAAQ